MKASPRRASSLLAGVLGTLTLLQAPPAAAICGGAHGPPSYDRCQVECFEDYGQLMDELTGPTRRSRTLRMVQNRHGRAAPMARHNQYGGACFFFSVAPILEYLGYSKFKHAGSLPLPFSYRSRDDLESVDFDVGYRGSPEELILHYYEGERVERTVFGEEGAEIYPCGFFANERLNDDPRWGPICDKYTDPRLTINDAPRRCDRDDRFLPGQEYGMCQNVGPAGTVDSYPAFLDEVWGACGDGCPCTRDAHCGALHFLNRRCQRLGGCSDARSFDSFDTTPAEKDALRRIIRAFIDNNVPLLATVNSNGHWLPIVGYADLDTEGLPETAITVDSVDRVYWLVDLKVWNVLERYSLRSIFPWNQDLDRGCEPGGWARKTDAHIRATYGAAVGARYRLCGTASMLEMCGHDQYYGAELVCERDTDGNGSRDLRERYVLFEPDLFVAERRSVACDRLTLRWRDGARHVTRAQVERFEFDPGRGRWLLRSTRASDEPPLVETRPPPGRVGPTSTVVWDRQWTDAADLVAGVVHGDRPLSRTTIGLQLDTGDELTVEVAPPGTYGIEVSCMGESARASAAPGAVAYTTRHSFKLQPYRSLFRVDRLDHKVKGGVPLADNVACDALLVRTSLGAGDRTTRAQVESLQYSSAAGWRPNGGVVAADSTVSLNDGLSGDSMTFLWGTSWSNGRWLAAHDVIVGGSRRDYRTVIRLLDAAGHTTRIVEFAPQVGQQPPATHPPRGAVSCP